MDLIIVAAGKGLRFGSDLPKALQSISGLPIIAHTLRALSEWNVVKRIIIVAPVNHLDTFASICSDFPKALLPVAGGKTRYESVQAGLTALGELSDRVAIHDGARPLVSSELLRFLDQVSIVSPVTIPGIPLTDTIKKVSEEGRVISTIPRDDLWSVQTPQIFHREVIQKLPKDANPTDEASLAEELGYPVMMVQGDPKNIKVTWPEDLTIVEKLLEVTK